MRETRSCFQEVCGINYLYRGGGGGLVKYYAYRATAHIILGVFVTKILKPFIFYFYQEKYKTL